MNDPIERQAAIDAIVYCTVYGNAYDLKEAVMQENAWNKWSGGVLEALEAVEELPSAQPEIVRCKDCEHRDPEDKKCDCGHAILWQLPRQDDWYCADAERRTDEGD